VLAAAVVAAAALGGPPPAAAADPAAVDPAPTGSAATARPVPAEPAAPVPRVVWRGPAADRVVALTFDDGWNPATLRAIQRILVRENVAATFFVTGVYVKRDPALWRSIAARFPLANHSHLHRDMRRLTDAALIADLARARSVVEAATGRRMLPYVRPPYGARNVRTDRLAAAAGFPTIVMWNVTAADTVRRPTTRRVARSAAAGRPGSIVLLHAGPRVTVRALPAIIARYRERGFRFVTLPELLGDPWPTAAAGPAPRAIDRPGGEVATRGSPGADASGDAPAAPVAGGDAAPRATPAAPAVAVATGPPASPARDAAWARSAGTPWALAVGTAAVLLAVLALAALLGRGRREDDATA
jgi:peptidoglycan/xylan/chitin deacetylase (PgdA/CDA1 family)